MPGRYLKGVWKIFWCLKVVCRVSERFRKVSGGCLEVSGGGLSSKESVTSQIKT